MPAPKSRVDAGMNRLPGENVNRGEQFKEVITCT